MTEMGCGLCGTTPAGLYPAGRRCTIHTPAAIAGRPEAPPPTGRLDVLSDTERGRLAEVAIAHLEKKQADKLTRERQRRW